MCRGRFNLLSIHVHLNAFSEFVCAYVCSCRHENRHIICACITEREGGRRKEREYVIFPLMDIKERYPKLYVGFKHGVYFFLALFAEYFLFPLDLLLSTMPFILNQYFSLFHFSLYITFKGWLLKNVLKIQKRDFPWRGCIQITWLIS